jgi:phosphonate transport system permease protein
VNQPAPSVIRLSHKSLFPYIFAALFLLAFIDSWRRAGIDLGLVFEAQGRTNLWKFVSGMFPPDLSWQFLSLLLQPALETIQISSLGTLIAAMIGFPLGLLGTNTLIVRGVLNEAELQGSPVRRGLRYGIYLLARGLLSLFRSIPEFVWAFMFVRAVGLGPFPGILAIGVAYGGMLGKVYSEIFEAVNYRPLEALQAVGANKLQLFFYGWFPQALPNFISYTLYRWECAVRASAILGLVGAGGLGQQLEISMRMFNFNEVVTILAILFLMVAGVDFISAKVRNAVSRSPGQKSSDTIALPGVPTREEKTAKNTVIVLGTLGFFIWSYRGAEIQLSQLFNSESFEQIATYVKKLVPPDISAKVLQEALKGTVETFAISFMGTLMAVIIAVFIVFFASRNLIYSGLLYEMEPKQGWKRAARMLPYLSAKSALNVLRTIPEMVWALIFVFLVGLGPFPGVLALGTHTAGVLGKLFSEVLEDVDTQPIESLQATGANRLQILFYGILPQVLPQFISYTLYRWEVNIRVAAVLGFVGAGGLGQRIHIAISLFLENQLLTLIIAIYILVTVVDYLSAYLRRKVI